MFAKEKRQRHKRRCWFGLGLPELSGLFRPFPSKSCLGLSSKVRVLPVAGL